MTVSGLPYPKRDGDYRCMECGRKPPPARGKRRHVAVAMGVIPGFNGTHLTRRYRAVITPMTMRVQRLAANSELSWARERFKDRYHWIDVQVIRRPKRRLKGEPHDLLLTLSDFESAILTGALARRLRDAARVIAEDTARRRALWKPAGTRCDLMRDWDFAPNEKHWWQGWWSRQFVLFPWLAIIEYPAQAME